MLRYKNKEESNSLLSRILKPKYIFLYTIDASFLGIARYLSKGSSKKSVNIMTYRQKRKFNDGIYGFRLKKKCIKDMTIETHNIQMTHCKRR